MVTDYEAAWIALGEFVASKTQHGRESLLASMAGIAAECRVPAGELSRLLRLHGVEVERARSIAAEHGRDEADGFGAGFVSAADDDLPAHHRPDGGHDGNARSAGEGGRGVRGGGAGGDAGRGGRAAAHA